MLIRLGLALILSLLAVSPIKAETFAWYIANTSPAMSKTQIETIFETEDWTSFQNLAVIEFLLHNLFAVPYTDLFNKNIIEKTRLLIENFNTAITSSAKKAPEPVAPIAPIVPVVVPPPLITTPSSEFHDLKAELLEIYKQLSGRSIRDADYELILNLLLHNLFGVNNTILSSHNLTNKKTAFSKSLTMLGISGYAESTGWNIDNFNTASISAGEKLNAIKIKWSTNSNNLVYVESLLNQLFGYTYQNLIHANLASKKLDLRMSFDSLGKIISNPFDEPFYKSNTGPLTPEELLLAAQMQSDTSHFKELELLPGQHQKGVECGSYAIMHAWAIEQLLKTDTPITAANIYNVTKPFITSKPIYLINRFIQDDEICKQIPKLIEDDLEINNFKTRVNFVGYHAVLDETTMIERGINYTGTASSRLNWFSHSGDISLVAPQLKVLLTLPPHVQHFLYNTGGHWILASVVQKPGSEAVIYFIDSMGSSPFSNEIRSRFVLTLYENFVKH